MRVRTIGALALLALGCAATSGRGQSERAAGPVEALATKQQMIRDRLARLEDRMFRLREKLSTAEPENARRLEAALEQAGARDVQARIDRLVEALRAQGAADAPIAEQDQLLADLEAVMGVLLDRNPDDAARREELERLAEIKEGLERVIGEQLEQRQAAARSVQAKRLAKRMGETAAELEQLKQDQAELAERTGRNPPAEDPDAKSAPAEQAKLAERAAALQREVEQLSRRLGELQEAGEDARAEAPDAQKPKEVDASPSPLDDAAKNVEGAKQDMQQAADQQQADKAADVQPKQREAADKLERAIHRLQEEQEKLDPKGEDKSPADEQRRVAGETQRLAEQMKPPSGAEGAEGEQAPQPQDAPGNPGEQGPPQDQPGQPPPQQPQPQQPQPQKPTPGQENVERAKQHMDDAAEKLDEKDTEQAILEQDKALDELDRAKRELEETLKQLRKEEQEEVLAGLEARLREMLQKQADINAETQPLAALGADHFTRAETLKCAELSERQREVSAAAGMGVRLLEEDGTTVVFPNILRQLEADTQTIAERLAGAQVGPLTTAMQADVHAALTELLESLQKIREKMEEEKQSGGGGGGAGASPALVPTSAELKLLKSSQQRINRQTTAAEQAAGRDDAGGEIAEILKRAAEQQQDVLNMARGIQERAEKEMQP